MRLLRILMDPTAEAGGAAAATEPATAPNPATTPASPTPTTTATAAAKIEMSPDEYRAFLDERNRYAQWEADRAKERAEAQAKEFAALTKAGETEKLMNLLKQQMEENTAEQARKAQEKIDAANRAAQQLKEAADAEKARLEGERRAIQTRAERFALDGELGRALSSHNLVDGAAEDLTALLRNSFTVQPEGDSFVVRASGKTAAEFVAEYLARKPHYVKSGSKGGTQPNANAPAPVDSRTQQQVIPEAPAQPIQANNLGEYVVSRMLAEKAARPGGGDPRFDPQASMFGLRPAPRG